MGPEPPALTVGELIRDLFVRYELPRGGEAFGVRPVGRAESIQMVWEQLCRASHPTNIETFGVRSILMGVGR